MVVRNVMRVDESRDDVEWWPTIVAFGQDEAPHPMPLVTGATKTAELAWDLIEAVAGRPAPARAYRIEIVAVPNPDDYEVDW